MKLQEKIRNFMYGRYGYDELYTFLFYVYLFLLIVDLFFNSRVLSLLELITIFIVFYRIFSKNIYARSNENRKYLKIKKELFNKLKKHKDKNHIYKKCRYCKTTLKLPLPDKIGIKHVKCPKCKKRLSVFVLKKQRIKVEIIKNKRSVAR